ncbi:efflux RND transporter permease subunit, partial [Salmonella enterica]|uniref:efflux RND transporter permease subunit n=1 Tax=Salmonella enterica TaxID=28901 RepID=UPI000A5A22CB
KAQNAPVAAGSRGGTPPGKGQQRNASIFAQKRLTPKDEFGKIPLKGDQEGSQGRLRVVAKNELGGGNYHVLPEFNGQPAPGLG